MEKKSQNRDMESSENSLRARIMKGAVILALFQGSNAKEMPPFSTIRASFSSEIARSIFLVLPCRVGGAFAVATYFEGAVNL